MKKVLILFFLLSTGLVGYGQSDYSAHNAAPGFATGDRLFSAFVGMASPNGKSGVRVGNPEEELAWGDNGVQYGIEGMAFATPYIGYGLEISGMNTTYAAKKVAEVNYRTAMSLWNGLLRLRLNVNPYHPVRLYIPVGAGMTYARSRCYTNTGSESMVGHSLSFGYFAGLGLETDWSRAGQSVGLEVRYHGFAFDTDKLLDGRPASGNKNYGYLSVLLKLNYRF